MPATVFHIFISNLMHNKIKFHFIIYGVNYRYLIIVKMEPPYRSVVRMSFAKRRVKYAQHFSFIEFDLILSCEKEFLEVLLRETKVDDEPIDLTSVELSHYRLSKLKEQDLLLVRDRHQGLSPAVS